MKQAAIDHEPELEDSIHLESDPVNKLFRVAAYELTNLQSQFNDHAKRLFLAP